ncbi:TetR/AcrR family transcriptional regulator [Brachybacterium alimentarium]|uniref:TetR/AcrR family transcriptional regulator n=1 Tax=Brachybacterium alimentarium TaxID=47845 RepID=UPI003FD67C20
MERWCQTHEALRRAAAELFAERGYDAATTAQVADRAGVSEMTLFRHFPTKERLLLADPFDPLMADAVQARPAHEPAMTALAEGIRQAWGRVDAESARTLRNQLRIIARAPALRGAIERNSDETVAALVAALRVRGVEETPARVAAAAVIAGLSTALLEWARSEHTPVDVAIASALDLLGGG